MPATKIFDKIDICGAICAKALDIFATQCCSQNYKGFKGPMQ